MEVVGAASSIAGLVSLSGTILAQGYAFLARIHGAPKELRALLKESAALAAVLDQIQVLNENSQDAPAVELYMAEVLKECNEVLLFVHHSVETCRQVEGQKWSNAGKRLLWPFHEKETNAGLTRLVRLTNILSTALTTNMANMLKDVKRSSRESAQGIADVQVWTASRDRAEALRSLNPNSTNMEDNLRAALEKRLPGTGVWLFEDPKFKIWLTGESSVLWVNGIPGSGKTVLASSVVSKLLHQASGSSKALLYFFCDRRDDNKRSWRDFLATAILQLVQQRPGLEEEVLLMFRNRGNGEGRIIPLEDQLSLVEKLLQNFQALHVIIDALDESKGVRESTDRETPRGPVEFAQGLAHLLKIGGGLFPVRVFVTSRNDYALEPSIGALSTHRINLNDLQHEVTDDISKLVASEVDRRIESRTLKIRSSELKDRVLHVLTYHAYGMFIWAIFQLHLISRLTTDKAIVEALNRLPPDLYSTYFQLLERVVEGSPENVDIAVRSLRWLTSVRIPITLGQLVEAISIDPGDMEREPEKIMTEGRDLLQILGSLVVFDTTKLDPVVSLAHPTLYEFLASDELRRHQSLSKFFVPASFGSDIGITCIQYLSFSDFGTSCLHKEQLEQRKASYKFLELAAHFFSLQIESNPGMTPRLSNGRSLLRWFLEPGFDGRENFTSWKQVYHDQLDVSTFTKSPLWYAEFHLRFSHYNSLLLKALTPNYLDSQGYSSLHTAVICGSEHDARAVLGTQSELLEARSPCGHTALHFAAMYGPAHIVELLLRSGASIEPRNESGSTPFYHAARSGCVQSMELLYQAGAKIEARTRDGWTPIFEAMESQHIAATEWLVQQGANLKHTIRYNDLTVLQFARAGRNASIIAIIENGLSKYTR